MALVKEDGTGVVGASTYALADEVRSFAQVRGVTLPSDDVAVESLIIGGMDYLEGFRGRYQGSKTYTGYSGFYVDPCFPLPLPLDVDSHTAQALQWPRYGVTIDDVPIDGNTIPSELVSALCQCVIELFAGNDLNPSTNGQVVKREKVDVLETEYMTGQDLGADANFEPRFPKVDALLAPLFGTSAFIKTVRV